MILEAIHAHNTGDLITAIQIYTQIINAEPAPNAIVLSVIFKHRGMAYFAQNNFEAALKDFIKSTESDEKNFRSYYYVGIVLSVLNDHREALLYFDKSLEINEYQSHVYYRKALANYHLGDYATAMSDLTKASQLGLSDDDCKKLQETLVSKLGMGMN
jgi:tetratricopeptide (TPR) repeat protein